MVGSCQTGDVDMSTDGIGEVLGGFRREDVDIFLEAERRVEEHGVDSPAG